jgi:acyl-CoA thioesterase-1
MITCGAALMPALTHSKGRKTLPQVLLIGDSISLGYTKAVQELLAGKANVQRPLNAKGGFLNCQGTTFGVEKIDEWLGETKWDVIHFNFGLHDLKHVDAETGKNSNNPEDPQQADPKQYKKNMKAIVKRLKATGASLIFATTTPYPDKPGGPLRRADQPAIYNKVALKIMKRNKVMINDLYAFALPRLEKLQQPNNVHFSKEGSMELAKQVVEKILLVI